MASLVGFDATTVEPEVGFPVLPAGEYNVIIINSEIKATKAGTGKYLSLELQILDGPSQNKKLFDKLNTSNPNEIAQRIGRATLSQICRSVNVLQPKDSSELHNKPLRCKVVIENSTEYGQQNVIKAYMPRNAVAMAQVAQTQDPNFAANTVTSTSKPW